MSADALTVRPLQTQHVEQWPVVCRVRFATGPLQDHYETPDGHPNHEGETARQRRALQVPPCLPLAVCLQELLPD